MEDYARAVYTQKGRSAVKTFCAQRSEMNSVGSEYTEFCSGDETIKVESSCAMVSTEKATQSH